MSKQSIDAPSKNEVHRAYLAPETSEHWERIQRLVLTGGFGVEPNPKSIHGITEKGGKQPLDFQQIPDFRITWPTPELEAQDYQIFFKACQMVIKTLDLDDAVYSQSVLPDIFKVLEKSYLFDMLNNKPPTWRGITVRNHIETVPTLVQTSQVDYRERFILRITAIFHDVGKAFNIGRDQIHYHALIGSNIVSWFMEKYADLFINDLYLPDMRLPTPVLLKKKKGERITRSELYSEYTIVKNQIVETIRLHHVLEQIDKGVLDLNVVAQIFTNKQINPLVFGLFAIADGASVIPDNEIYVEFLINNLDALSRLLDRMEYQELIRNNAVPLEIKQLCAQSLQCVISEVIEKIADLPEKVKKIIADLIKKIDTVLAVSLLSLVDPTSVL